MRVPSVAFAQIIRKFCNRIGRFRYLLQMALEKRHGLAITFCKFQDTALCYCKQPSRCVPLAPICLMPEAP